MSIVKTNALIPCPTATDHTGLDGHFVAIDGATGAVALPANATTAPYGLIVDGGLPGENDTVAVCRGGVAGTVRVKLSGNPGTVNPGTILALDATAPGKSKADPGTGARVLVAQSLEIGTADELVEAVLINPEVIAGA